MKTYDAEVDVCNGQVTVRVREHVKSIHQVVAVKTFHPIEGYTPAEERAEKWAQGQLHRFRSWEKARVAREVPVRKYIIS